MTPSAARRSRGDDGMTLVELLVGTVVTGVVLTMLAALVLTTLRSTSEVTAKNDATRDAQTALAAMTQTLRVAQPLVSRTANGTAVLDAGGNRVEQAVVAATPSALTFFASLSNGATADPPPTRVTYAYSSSRACLVEQKVQGVPAVNATGETWYQFTGTPTERCLARGVVNAEGSALFSYATLPRATASATAQLVNPAALAAPATGMSAPDLQRVMQVTIDLDLTATSGTVSADTGLKATVSLVNTLNKGSR